MGFTTIGNERVSIPNKEINRRDSELVLEHLGVYHDRLRDITEDYKDYVEFDFNIEVRRLGNKETTINGQSFNGHHFANRVTGIITISWRLRGGLTDTFKEILLRKEAIDKAGLGARGLKGVITDVIYDTFVERNLDGMWSLETIRPEDKYQAGFGIFVGEREPR